MTPSETTPAPGSSSSVGNGDGSLRSNEVTRLAPSPTGALHLGNARTFLINWALAKQRGWRIVLRIEDLDGPRTKQDADTLAIDLLAWLGMDWDEGPYYQAQDLRPYHDMLCGLLQRGDIYPCTCSRKEIQDAQSAPHENADAHELRYPGTCRPDADTDVELDCDDLLKDSSQAWRIFVHEGDVTFDDQMHGPQSVDVHAQVGDFIVASKAGLPAYQLAVVIDDARQGITQVVRGDDLIRSTGRQLLLYQRLGLEPVPTYTHLPLVLGPDGKRLAKRHGDTRLDTYRKQGIPAERIIGLLAAWSGIVDQPEPMSAADFAKTFEISKMSKQPVTHTQETETWLLQD